MIPELKWQGGLRADGERHGIVELDAVALGDDARKLFHEMIGRINARAIRFAGHIALHETLLLRDVVFPRIDGALTRHQRGKVRLFFAWQSTRGRCEDGVIRHVGFNREQGPDGVFIPLNDVDEGLLFERDTEAHPDGFAALWS